MEATISKYKDILLKAKNKIKQLENMHKEDDIAITGYACRFPGGANDTNKYWDLLKEGYDATREIDRFDINKYYDEEPGKPGKIATRYASFLDVNIKSFDHAHFDITANEAKSMDPQHRLLLEISWEALLDSGVNFKKLKNSNTGVFIGIDSFDYFKAELGTEDKEDISPYSLMGVSQHSAAGRISYFYDLKGPAMVCNTACSSSLTALNAAVTSLKNKECDMAIVGGVNLLINPEGFIGLSSFKALSPDGKCKTFDASANGFGRGEGCGVIILKRLSDAEKNNDKISALVKGIYVGQDGKANGYYAPNGRSEQRVIENAIKDADISLDDIDYVETHGTGTVLGDLIESQALTDAFKSKTNKVKIGSVKSNIGHLEAASGMASIIKVLLSMKHGMIPQSIHVKELNPEIDWNRIELVDKLTKWDKDGKPRVAGINSFGISGSLVHVVLKEYIKEDISENSEIMPNSLLMLSAKNKKQLDSAIKTSYEYLQNNKKNFNDILYTLNKYRSGLDYRFAITGKDNNDLLYQIKTSIDDEKHYENNTSKRHPRRHKIAFMFTGQGAIYKNIADQLYKYSSVYRESFDRCSDLFSKTLNVSIQEPIYGGKDQLLKKGIYSQAITFSVEYALYKYWCSIGIEPDVVIGHSIGEYAAACAAGILSLEDAVKMISWRGQLMDSTKANGKMLGILTSKEDVDQAILESKCKNVGIAAINTQKNVTLSGTVEDVDKVIDILQEKKRVFVNDLNIAYPFHTKMMEKYEKNYTSKISQIDINEPKTSIVSTVTANLETKNIRKSSYWAGHLSKPVNFADAINKVRSLGVNIFIEIGGNATLSGLAAQSLKDDNLTFLPSLRNGIDDFKQILESVKGLYLSGIDINSDLLYSDFKHEVVEIYPYSFQRKELWSEPSKKQDDKKTMEEKSLNNNIDASSTNSNITKGKKDKINKIKNEILEDINLITGMDADELETDKDLFSFGLDSLMLLTLSNRISSNYKMEFPLDVFFTSLNTIDKITEYIVENSPNLEDEESIDEDLDTGNKTITGDSEVYQEVAATEDSRAYQEVSPRQDSRVYQEIAPTQVSNYPLEKPAITYENKDVITSLLNNQLAIMQEQNNIVKKLLNGQTSQINENVNIRTNSNKQGKHSTISSVEEDNKSIVLPSSEDKEKKIDYFVPYVKQDYKENNNKLDDLKTKYIKKITNTYTSMTPRSKEYVNEYRFVNANARHNAGFKMEYKDMLYQIVAQKGCGSKLIDMDGNEIIDVTMGFGVNFFGHGPKFVKDALREEIENGFPLGPLGRLTGKVAEKISNLSGVERVFFCNSGTEADMYAMRIARAVTGKKKIVSFAGAYHGTYDGVLGLPNFNDDGTISAFPMAPGITEGSVSDLIILNYDTQRALDYINDHSDEIAGVLVEPVQSRRPDIQPREFLKELRKITEDNEIALIFDEVITGFRIGPGGAQEYFDIQADIATYGKVIGGGMPIGVVSGKSKYMDSIDGGVWNFGDDSVPQKEEQRTYVAGTFCHHPMTMAATNATLDYIIDNKDTIYPEINVKTDNLVMELNTFFEKEEVPFYMVNYGSLFRFMIDKQYEIFYYGMLSRGIYIWEGRNCFLSTEHSQEDIRKIIDAAKETTKEMKQAGFFGKPALVENDNKYIEVNLGQAQEKASDEIRTYPASLIQERLYTQIKILESDPFDVVTAFASKQPVNEIKIVNIINQIIQRHEVLRTALVEENGELIQKICPECKIYLKKMESNADDTNLIRESITKFDLSQAPLIEIIQVKRPTEYVLIFHFHHTLVDGMSMGVFTQEFIKLYKGEQLLPLKKQYTDFVDWEKEYLNSDKLESERQFYKESLADCIDMIPLTYDSKPEGDKNTLGSTFVSHIPKELVSGLKELAKQEGVSMFILLLAITDTVLYKISGETDFAVTTPVSSRFSGGFLDNLGMFTNTIALGCHIDKDEEFTSFLQKVKKSCLASYGNINYPFNMLIDDLNLKGGDAFNVNYVFENTDGRDPTQNINLEMSRIPFIQSVQEDELTFELLEENGLIEVQLGYRIDLFNKSTIERIFGYLYKTIETVLEDKKALMKDINIISEDEMIKVRDEFNNTAKEYDKEKTVIELFEDQVSISGEKTAIVFNDQKLTYKELNEKSNVIAHKLREMGIGREDVVAIVAERSMEMIIAIWGILKSGGAYLPIDPTNPKDRFEFIIEDSMSKAILTFATEVKAEIPVIKLEEEDVFVGNNTNPARVNSSQDLAYIIYTSGTTGKPKGVMTEHLGLHNLLVAYTDIYDLTKEDVVLQVANYTFDQSVWDIFNILVIGGRLCLISYDDIRNPSAIAKVCNDNGVTVASFTPVLITELNPDDFKTLRIIDSSGEAANLPVLIRWIDKCKVINTYGPTEVTVNTSSYVLEDKETSIIPIGKPIANTQVYILKDDKLCGVGMIGEICIAGDGVSRGYLNRPELNGEKFVDNPFGKGKMYKSGDLGRWLPDGNIDTLGRMDDQVQIRGFRIELGEIENVIRKQKDIVDCAILTKKDSGGDKAIYAYLVSDNKLDIEEIKHEIGKSLPDYMVPSYIAQIDEIPISRSGKLARRELPEIALMSEKEYIAPRDNTEEIICEIFKEILKVEIVGIKDDFFELGGHSLRASRMANIINQRLSCSIPLRKIFAYRTPEGLAKIVRENTNVHQEIPKAKKRDFYPMSSSQKRIFLISQIDDGNLAYNMPAIIKIKGEIDFDKLQNAFRKLVERHEILRTKFLVVEGELVQCIQEHVEAKIEYEESDKDDKELSEEFVKVFDLSKTPLVNAKVVKRKDETLLFIDMHHIISDGISLNIFQDELIALYNDEKLEPSKRQYKDYSEWMSQRDLSDQKDYWVSQFSDSIPVLDLPLDKPRLSKQSYKGNTFEISSSSDLLKDINKTSEKYGLTNYMVFLAGAMILLGQYSRQEDIVIGNSISARNHTDLEEMLGMFVNTLAMRGKPEKTKKVEDFLLEIKEIALSSYENQEYPFEELVEVIDVPRELSRNPLFDVMLVLQNVEESREDINGATIKFKEINDHIAKFDLTFNLMEEGGRLKLFLEYCTDLFFDESAVKIAKHYFEVLEQITKAPEKKIQDINLILPEDRIKILEEYNDTKAEYPKNKTIIELFEEQVKKTPEETALEFGKETLTYRELNNKANILGNRLRNEGIGPDDFVAIIAERSLEMIIGIFGVLKAGGAYVPMDPTYPQDRITYMLDDCSPSVVLTYNYDKQLDGTSIIDLEEINLFDSEDDEEENLAHISRPEDLIYCIYTSGTTGKPKGVLLENRNVVRLLKNSEFQFDFNSDDVWTMFHSYSFDFSVWELYGAVLTGAKLIVLSKEEAQDTYKLIEIIKEKGVTVLNQVPSSFYNLMEADDTGENMGLRYLIFGGEALSPYKLKDWYLQNPQTEIVNMYGITETTVHVTYRKIGIKEIERGISDIGQAIPTLKAYIMEDDSLCGIGVPGELCVVGAGVARGYLNRDKLTGEKFVDNPFGDGKMYRSGDLARWLPDGNIEFIGRMDDQVKVRGYRIELGEIENNILTYPGVTGCVVSLRDNKANDKAIFAYILSNEEINFEELRNYMRQELPDYMVPAYIMQIDEIPVTSNGKVDRKALPDIETESDIEYIEPETKEEIALCKVLTEVLGIEKVGLKDNFFLLGGDSIKAIRIISKLREKGYELELADVLQMKTVKELANTATKTEEWNYEQAPVTGLVNSTPIMKEFENMNLAKPWHYNQSVLVNISVGKEALIKALDILVDHHDILRAVYKDGLLEIMDIDHNSYEVLEYKIKPSKNIKDEIKRECNLIQESFNLESGPLVKLIQFEAKEEEYIFICIHHLLIDGVSWQILLSDLQSIVASLEKGEEVSLPMKTASFIEWSETLEEYAATYENLRQLDYWRKIKEESTKGRFNKDLNRDGQQEENIIEAELNKEITDMLLYEANKAYNTGVNDILLTALGSAAKQIDEKDKLTVFLEGHGREKLHKKIDVDNTVGWFTSLYPVVIPIKSNLETSLIETKEMLREVPAHGIGYGLLKEKYPEINTNADISFNYLGHMDAGFSGGQLSDLPTGLSSARENRSISDINIDSMIVNNSMKIIVSYNKNMYSQERVEKLVNTYMEYIEEIVELCSNEKDSIKTASDFGSKDLKQSEFDEIMDMF